MRRRPTLPTDHILHGFSFFLRVLTVLFLVLALTMIGEKQKTDQSTSSIPAGELTIEAVWPGDVSADVDLWTRAPLDVQAVGYSRRTDRQTSYLRDDIGTVTAATHYEFSFCRVVEPGPYVVNLHLYQGRGRTPIPVKVTATLTPRKGAAKQIASRTVDLTTDGQEITAFAFTIGAQGEIELSQDVFIPLREAHSFGDSL